ncbi:class C sortase [Xylanimonas ulmi]|uniref:LPXTG-site transpeptidase (Sortase) family protein n=1 Tax=Xylanimonas ulmi TaxID=228973 RepID=A0A4V2EXQ4_9MICO|nr:class C sortase [Xylanibacterium ulmi]RZS60300.1 LPXTG-site transpeptidase (sortase) family protein [Xylanibacterium ulmi]
MLILAVLGVGVLQYPSAVSWFTAHVQASQVTGYSEEVDRLPLAVREAELSDAVEYNSHLPGSPLGDPYNPGPEANPSVEGVAQYFDTLASTSAMARLRIPTIGVDLPIYHGTGDEALSHGVGHMFGSSLPVGGAGTHAVLAAHSGLVNAKMFDDLHKLQTGDRFTVIVLGEILTYEVDQILVVTPNDTEALRAEAERDYITLVTCTPIGVNSHRVLVRGERIATNAAASGSLAVPEAGQRPGFPWWAVIIVGVPSAFALALRPRRSSRPPRQPAPHRVAQHTPAPPAPTQPPLAQPAPPQPAPMQTPPPRRPFGRHLPEQPAPAPLPAQPCGRHCATTEERRPQPRPARRAARVPLWRRVLRALRVGRRQCRHGASRQPPETLSSASRSLASHAASSSRESSHP